MGEVSVSVVQRWGRSRLVVAAVLLLGPTSSAATGVTRVFGGTAGEARLGDAGDERKLAIYTGVMCSVGGLVALFFLSRLVYAVLHRRKSLQVISPSDSSVQQQYRAIIAGDIEEVRVGEESKDPDSSSPSKPKRKIRIKLGKTGNHSMTVQSL